MCASFCDRNSIGLRVPYKNNVIYRNAEGPKDQPIIVYAIWSNHAFFYDSATVKNGASQLPTAQPVARTAEGYCAPAHAGRCPGDAFGDLQ
jgi:hypothetical protein